MASRGASQELVHSLLAGLEVGVLGGLGVVLWYLGASRAGGRIPEELLLRLAEALFRWEYMSARGWAGALAGASAQVCACGLAGVFYGLVVWRVESPHRRWLLAILCGLVLYYCWRLVLGPPGGIVFVERKAVMFGHVLFGLMLGQHQRVWRGLEEPQGQRGGRARAGGVEL